MFSYFSHGVTHHHPYKTITLPELVSIIKDNPNRTLVEWIRHLRRHNNLEYKELKRRLPTITTNCTVKSRKLSDQYFGENFLSFNQYIYFDIDTSGEEYKQYIINRYGHQLTMVCTSCSAGGVSLLFRVSNTITRDNFDDIWYTIRNTLLKEEPVDESCKDIGRILFISYDPDLYINYENEILLPELLIRPEAEKSVKQPITSKGDINRLIYTFSELPVFENFINKIKTKTEIHVTNPIVDFNPVEFVDITFLNPIIDNKKHKIYTVMIHKLVYLNPGIDPIYLFAYLNFINNQFAQPPMEYRELQRLFSHVYGFTHSKGYEFKYKQMKYIHVNPAIRDTHLKQSNPLRQREERSPKRRYHGCRGYH